MRSMGEASGSMDGWLRGGEEEGGEDRELAVGAVVVAEGLEDVEENDRAESSAATETCCSVLRHGEARQKRSELWWRETAEDEKNREEKVEEADSGRCAGAGWAMTTAAVRKVGRAKTDRCSRAGNMMAIGVQVGAGSVCEAGDAAGWLR